MLWKKQLIDWRRTNGSTLIVLILIEGRSTVDSSSMRKAMKDGAGSKWRPATLRSSPRICDNKASAHTLSGNAATADEASC